MQIILCQILSNLYRTFRIGPLVTTNIMFGIQHDPINQDSSQGPSTSSLIIQNTNYKLSWLIKFLNVKYPQYLFVFYNL